MGESRSYRSWLVIATIALLALLGVAGAKSYQDFEAARAQEETLKTTIAATEAEITELERKLELLEKDPSTIEKIAREELWMARPAEVVIVLPPGS
ncbi:MAG TPA: septum formation initiator family protein [Thermoanaerobaculia bacterium]|nr:septum formation initiator family protein [Thermoanaerobaculia bacterium]